MKQRLKTSLYITIALILVFVTRIFTNFGIDALVGFLAVIGTVEIARVLERQKKYNTISLAGLYPAVMYIAFIYILSNSLSWYYYFAVFVAVFILFFVLSMAMTYINKKEYNKEIKLYDIKTSKFKYAWFKAINTSMLFVYPTLLFIATIMLNNIALMPIFDIVPAVTSSGFFFFTVDIFFILLAIIISVSTDSMAYIVGSLLKGPKLAPIISPKKTISGAVGGLFGGALAALLLYAIFNTNAYFATAFASVANVWFVVIVGVVGSLFCQMGDLFASYLKRKSRVKDYGTIFPGHGGVMDRVDGLIVTATVVFVSVIIMLSML